jgi:hypothetical protein
VQVAAWPLGESDQDITPIPPEGVMTDAAGRFSFEGLAEGRWRIILRTARYERPRLDLEFEASVGRTDTLPDIILSRGGVLAGTLRDERGQPLAGYELFAVPKARAADATVTADRRRSRTDPAGRFEFAALQPFDWVIVGSSMGGAPLGEAHVGWHDRVDLELVAPAGALPAR